MATTPSRPTRTTAPRRELLDELLTAERTYTTTAAAFHSAATAAQGLTTTERRALDILEHAGSLTPRELTARLGLAPASVTGLIDRLESKGFAHRLPHPHDRRSITVAPNRRALAAQTPPQQVRTTALTELSRNYTRDQLNTIIDFLTKSTALYRDLLDTTTSHLPKPTEGQITPTRPTAPRLAVWPPRTTWPAPNS